jgi:hypothetical protein
MIFASLALVFAMAGTGLAGVATIGALSKGEKGQVRKISRREADRRITARSAGLSVGHAVTADSATRADSATDAERLITGAPIAYAAVNGDGSLTAGYPAKNIDAESVTTVSPGGFCFDLPFTPVTAAANPQAELEEDGIISVDLVPPYTACPAGAEAEVRNVDAITGPQDDSFIVQFDG